MHFHFEKAEQNIKLLDIIYTEQKFWPNTQKLAITFLPLRIVEWNLEHYMQTNKQISSVYQIEICFQNEVCACAFTYTIKRHV